MAHEPNDTEILVEAMFAAFRDPAPMDLDLSSEAGVARATVGGGRFRMTADGFVEQVEGRFLSRTGRARAMDGALREAIAVVRARVGGDPAPGGPGR